MSRLIVLLMFLTCSASAQLYVSPNSYVFVRDQVLFVAQDVNLQANGHLYLRREAQLLQGTGGTSANRGNGNLSVFQEGTSDEFDYNYWCAPVGVPSASPGNANFGIGLLGAPSSVTNSIAATALPAGSLNGTANPLAIASAWIYKFLNSNDYSQWIFVGSAATIGPGEGFTMKGTSGADATSVEGVQNNPGGAQRYDFRGKPNDGNIQVAVGTDQLTLTGNPYPSALHLNAFLLDTGNSACTGIAYFWEQNKSVDSHYLQQYQGGYGTYSPVSLGSTGIYVPATFDTYDGSGDLNSVGTSSGLAIERKYAPIGQGFMIKGQSSGTVTLRNSHRIYYTESGALSQFERMASAQPGPADADDGFSLIRINAILNNQYTRQLALALIPSASDAVDRGVDALSPAANDIPNDVYFLIDSDRYVIQGTNFDLHKRIPIGVKSAAHCTFRFYIPEAVAFDPHQPVFIFDAQSGTYHNIRTGMYDVTLDSGTYHNRFELTFVDGSLVVIDNDIAELDVIQNNDEQFLSVYNPAAMLLSACEVYDMGGKRVMAETQAARMSRIPTSSLSDGVYVVRIFHSAGEFSKKIVVSRKY